MTFKFKVAAAAVAFLAIGAAQAQKAPEPDFTIAYNVGAVSQYRFRGIEQTSGTPALQAGLDFAHKNGFYAGVFTSSIKWIQDANGASAGEREIDYFAGYKASFSNINLDLGVIRYDYPANNSGAGGPGAGLWSNATTNEAYIGMGYGLVNFKYSHSLGDFLGNIGSSGSKYYDLSLNFDLGNGMSLVPHIGRQTIPNVNPANSADYTDYALTLNKDFGNGWSASLAAIGTNAQSGGFYQSSYTNPSRFFASNASVLGVKYTF